MLFELHNDATQRISHCGVLEFVAEEGMIIMPYWVCIKGSLFTCIFSYMVKEIQLDLFIACLDDAKHASSRG